MARTSPRGGEQTRDRIAAVASGLFSERGFEAVTVAEVARASGVSSVTVFNHFPRKEDLFFDRSLDADALLRAAVDERSPTIDVLESLRARMLRLLSTRHPLSGLDERSAAFFRTVEGSPALVARAREIAADLQRVLADELEQDPTFTGDAPLLAAFVVGGYATVLVETARRVAAGEAPGSLVADHRVRLERLFEALRHGVAASLRTGAAGG